MMHRFASIFRPGAFAAGLLLGLILLGVGACSRSEETDAPESAQASVSGRAADSPSDLLEVPRPDLSAADRGVVEQIEEQWRIVETLLANPSAGAGEKAEAFGRLGQIYLIYDFLEAAEASIENSRRLAPGDFRWSYLRGYLQTVQGRLEEAVPHLERAIALRGDSLPAHLRLARLRLELGEGEAARALFESALEIDPGSAAALEGLGKLAAAAGDAGAAVAYFEKAVALDPAATGLYYALAQAHRKLGNLDRARSYLEKRGDVSVRIPDPLLDPLAELGRSAQFFMMQAAEAMEDRSFESAAGSYQRALEQDAEKMMAYKGLAFCLQQLGDLDGAVTNLEQALDKGMMDDPAAARRERADILQILGGLSAQGGRGEEAIERFRASLEIDPGKPGVRLKLADALGRGGRVREALAEYDRVLASGGSASDPTPELTPEQESAVLIKRGTALVHLERRDEALADFRRAIEKSPEDSRPRLIYADALEFFGEGGKAAEERALARREAREPPEGARLAAVSAGRAVKQGDLEAAVEGYRRALAIDPALSEARYGLASVLGHLGRFKAALPEFARVVEESPRHGGARRGEITSLILLRRYGEARLKLQDALKLSPRDADLALIQARLLATVPDPRVRDGRLALEIARRVFQERKDLRVRETLAAAYAESGRFSDAVELQKGVVAEAEGRGDSAVLGRLRGELRAFESGRPWSAASPDEILAATVGG